jgi:hypothetical protein
VAGAPSFDRHRTRGEEKEEMRGAIIFLLMFACVLAVAEDKTPQQRVDARRASIEKKKDQDRAEEYAKLAVDLADLASAQYQADQSEVAHQTMNQIAEAADNAVKSAQIKRKHAKKAEIKLRECSRILNDLKHRLPSTEQDAAARALEAVENARNQLLEVMFGK